MKKYLPFVSLALIAIALIMFALPFVNFEATTVVLNQKNGLAYSLNGFQLAFGANSYNVTTFVNGKGSVNSVDADVKLNVLNLITFILIIVALIAGAVNLAVKTKFGKFISLGIAAVAVVAGVLLFLTLTGFFAVNELEGDATKNYALGAGAIIGAICLILGGAVEAVKNFLK